MTEDNAALRLQHDLEMIERRIRKAAFITKQDPPHIQRFRAWLPGGWQSLVQGIREAAQHSPEEMAVESPPH